MPRRAELSEAAVSELVPAFYARVRRDPSLAPVFARAVGETDQAWSGHLARMVDFWSSVMLTSGRYHGDPFSVHKRVPDLEPALFQQWLALFRETANELFEPELAALFCSRADRIARSLQMGLFGLPAKRRAAEAH
jgi:hemoglobin